MNKNTMLFLKMMEAKPLFMMTNYWYVIKMDVIKKSKINYEC